jgi:hypothetical protein
MKRRIRPFGQMLGLADHSPWHAPTLTRLIDEVLEQPYRRNNKNQPLPRDLRNLGAPPTAIAVGPIDGVAADLCGELAPCPCWRWPALR